MATILNNLALLYEKTGKHDKALSLYKEAIRIRTKKLGSRHPGMANLLRSQTLLYIRRKQYDKALSTLRKSQLPAWEKRKSLLSLSSQRQRLHYLEENEYKSDLFFSIIRLHHTLYPHKKSHEFALQELLRLKGLLQNLLLSPKDRLYLKKKPSLYSTYKRLQAINRRLVKLTWRGPRSKRPQAHKAWTLLLYRLQQAREALEETLNQQSTQYAFETRLGRLTSKTLSQNLPKDAALIEFVKFRFRFRTYPAKNPKHVKLFATQYMAFVLRHNMRPQLVDLGPAKPIDRAIWSLRNWIPRVPPPALGGFRRAFLQLKRPNQLLLQKLWYPLQTAIGPAKRLFLSPDGSLQLLPFEILRLPSGRFLIERYGISYLSNGRNLMRFSRYTASSPKQSVLLMGAPDFGQKAKTHLQRFAPLPGSLEELKRLARILKTTQHSGTKATKAAFLKLASRQPRLIHLATHGFFLPIAPQRLSPQTALAMRSGRPRHSLRSRFIQINPTLRAGLALAGANKGQGRGILTAQEIGQLELSKTSLFVLSACDTGIGKHNIWQGVSGLRSAIFHTGARSAILSLWKVPDQETALLMEHFYQRLQQGQKKYTAFRGAQLRLLRSLRKKYGVAHPLLWGAFVFQGHPGAL